MAAATPRGGFPYPAPSDPDDVPADLQRLAVRIADVVALTTDLPKSAPQVSTDVSALCRTV